MSFVFLQTWNFRSLYVSVFEFHFLTKLVKICSKWKGLTQEERFRQEITSISHCHSSLGVLLLHGYKNRADDCVCTKSATLHAHKVWCRRNYVHKPTCNCRKQFVLQWLCRGRTGGQAAGIPSQKPAINTHLSIHCDSNSYLLLYQVCCQISTIL